MADRKYKAYGYTQSVYLGLASPRRGLKNAENYAVFALCIVYPDLDCVGTYGSAIAKREAVPFQPAPEAVEEIQRDGSILGAVVG